ncbi:metallophosphoesterase family protein [Streptomyces sp. LN499]|uniref:metallophosphoesterase family protein n=1 Tax=Streptomyces sp. LN499 TaxID=3112977 RepID=UPI0037226569
MLTERGVLALNGHLLAVSDLHVAYADNRDIVSSLRPGTDADWLIVAGDVGEKVADVERAMTLLSERFARVVWVPGNHELWTHPSDPVRLRGEARYLHLVDLCRSLGVLTPEDPYPVWEDADGPVTLAPLFLLYDYTFRAPGATTRDWHRRFRAAAVIYGHLHIPRVTHHDGVRFEEVSIGYPREWRARPPREPLRTVRLSPRPFGDAP